MSSNKILLFGKIGQLGTNLFRLLKNKNLTVFDYPEIDFNHPDSLMQLIEKVQPALIINAAAYTNVDQAEIDQQIAMNVNGKSVGIIAKKAKELQAAFIHYSTDYVFDGTKSTAYHESDQPNPVNYYGRSKLHAEEQIQKVDGSYLIFRLSWVYSSSNTCFVSKVLNWSRINETLKIVDDQISNPTWARMVAEKTTNIIENHAGNWYEFFQQVKGIYHLTGFGEASRYDWAEEILNFDPNKHEQITTKLLPAKTDDFPTLAERPLHTSLDCNKFQRIFNDPIPPWKESLSLAMKNIPKR